MKILIIDNYDSFSHNLYHLVEAVIPHSWELVIHRNDSISLDAIAAYDKIIISPGPGLPADAGISCAAIARYAPDKSILGVCLGLQAICEVFGGRLNNLQQVLHGVAVPVQLVKPSDYLFRHCPSEFLGGRYHSWVADAASIPACLEVLATDPQGQVMALAHRHHDVRGVQFHPESVLTPPGRRIIKNWVLNSAPVQNKPSFVKIDSLDPV